MLTTTATESATSYSLTVTDGEYTFTYQWGKQPPEGQTTTKYLQSCKREAQLLAQYEIDKSRPPVEIVI